MESSLVTQFFLPGALFVIMLGLGLPLTPADFKRVFLYPKAAAVGLAVQILLLPVIGFGLANLLPMEPVLAVGLMLLAACPGGATSNLITWLAKGDTALSVTLTAISSFVSVLTIPLVLSFSLTWFMGSSQSVQVPFMQTVGQIVLMTLVPVSLGMLIRAKNPALAERLATPMKHLSSLLLAVIILGLILNQRQNLPAYFAASGPATISLNLMMLLSGWGAAALFGLSLPQRVTVSIEGGLQNGTLAIAIAAGTLKNPAMAVPPAIYSLVMFASAVLAIVIFNRLALAQALPQNQLETAAES